MYFAHLKQRCKKRRYGKYICAILSKAVLIFGLCTGTVSSVQCSLSTVLSGLCYQHCASYVAIINECNKIPAYLLLAKYISPIMPYEY